MVCSFGGHRSAATRVRFALLSLRKQHKWKRIRFLQLMKAHQTLTLVDAKFAHLNQIIRHLLLPQELMTQLVRLPHVLNHFVLYPTLLSLQALIHLIECLGKLWLEDVMDEMERLMGIILASMTQYRFSLHSLIHL